MLNNYRIEPEQEHKTTVYTIYLNSICLVLTIQLLSDFHKNIGFQS